MFRDAFCCNTMTEVPEFSREPNLRAAIEGGKRNPTSFAQNAGSAPPTSRNALEGNGGYLH